MCGRYSLTPESAELAKYYGVPVVGYRGPSFNVAPSQNVPVVTHDGATTMKWGLIPQWAKSAKVGYSMINAVGETIFDKPTYRGPILSSRCLVPASGFFEWLDTENGKQPYYFTVNDRPLVSLGGLFMTRVDSEGYELKTFTILTVPANGLVEKVHERMPLILSHEDEKLWLDPDMTEQERIAELIKPYSADAMSSYAVDRKVGNAGNDSPDLIQPLN